ncbi:MAG: gamma-glutamyl kinase [Pseudomonadota bacterium]
MMVSLKHRLVILAMPKCASTSLEAALSDQMDVVISRTPAAKHTPFRKYDRFLRRYLETYTDGPLEVVCLFREPIDWLNSWWRYRNRDGVPDPSRSARGMTFEDFVCAYLEGAAGPANVGSQARFVSNKDGAVGVDRIFRHDRFDHFAQFLEERLHTNIAAEKLNASPVDIAGGGLSGASISRARHGLQREFEIYETIAE